MGFATADLIVLSLLALSGVWGFMRGFVREVLGIAGWIGAIAATWFLFPHVRPIARDLIAIEAIADGAAGLVIFLIALVVFSLIAGTIAQQVRSSSLGALDRTLGFLFGLGRGALVACVALVVISYSVRPSPLPFWIAEARTLPILQRGADWLTSVLPIDSWTDRIRPDAPPTPSRSGAAGTDSSGGLQARDLMAPPTSPRGGAQGQGAVYNDAERRQLDQLFQPQRP
ncbi:MAG: CvpA family protein [Alphaproteobacteria bacterium]|nr:MAG: CvpA family protein [Alphaproteobacteria bacterium]